MGSFYVSSVSLDSTLFSPVGSFLFQERFHFYHIRKLHNVQAGARVALEKTLSLFQKTAYWSWGGLDGAGSMVCPYHEVCKYRRPPHMLVTQSCCMAHSPHVKQM